MSGYLQASERLRLARIELAEAEAQLVRHAAEPVGGQQIAEGQLQHRRLVEAHWYGPISLAPRVPVQVVLVCWREIPQGGEWIWEPYVTRDGEDHDEHRAWALEEASREIDRSLTGV